MASRFFVSLSRPGLWPGLLFERMRRLLTLPPGDLLRDAIYRRLWTSILISSLGGQITMLALPLTAAVLLNASPTQMGLLTSMEIAPFVLFSLPGGVWLDRVRKLPVYVFGEAFLGLAVATVPLAAWMGWLTMNWLYVVGFVLGTVYTIAGSAAQIVLTQVVSRDRLVEAHAKNALASSGAEVAGPGVAGVLIKLLGAPMALAVDAVLVLFSALILRGIKVQEQLAPAGEADFWRDLKAGVQFVRERALLVSLACTVGGWQLCYNAAQVVQILFATRSLGLSAQEVGLSYVALGAGTVLASVFGHRISARVGPGPCLVLGIASSGLGWLLLGLMPANAWGVAAFAFMLFMFGVGAVLIFINFLSLRQAVTPAPMLGRMTSTMRWLILIPAGPGALLGGWLGEHVGLRSSLLFAGVGALCLSLIAWRHPTIREVRELPKVADLEDANPQGVAGASGLALDLGPNK
ncbi:MFS transporter [Paucibacter sp. DJ2R-2]|uniref:MFS transporter n=1 Tax=Paucibacter sp. DJ2R-2 TaxID=2893558 RepID=UPI0021E4909B|nr:MFS transporter [Paucibacter sp. DJ2R-2]MCV2421684.1 MFS transporter [Paucibacter sp. DJ4R-1]MCV2438389.1 MFS transporter [Paucibacter sp. DJ2R-2]